MKKTFTKTILLLFALVVGISSTWATDYRATTGDTQQGSTTINNSNVSSGTITNNNVTLISWTGVSCTYSNSRVNIAANGSITFTAASGNNITKIVMVTGTSADYIGTWSSSAGSVSASSDGKTVTITGINTNSVTVTTSTAYRCTSTGYINVYYASSGYSVTYKPGEGATGTDVVVNGVSGSYTVKYNDGEGGTGFSKAGHTFNCWHNGTGNVAEGSSITVTGNVTLTAQWTPDTYTITYKAGEGTGSNVTETKTYGVNYTILGKPNTFTAPVSKPYFNGWLGSDENTYAAGATYSTNAALTLTAQWSAAASYTVSYDCNGGESGCPNNATVLDGTQINLPAAPTYTDHTFNGWMCDADLETYAAGATYTVTSNVGFEAQWLENLTNPTFSITGVSNGTANTYYVTANITIEQEDGADVYYTTDNSDPTILSTKYTAAFSVTESCTIKAIAIENGYANSQIVSQQISIVQPNEATFTSGIYNDLTSGFGDFYTYNVTGNQVWTWTSYSNTQCAYMNGYDNGRKENEDWLISPKLVAENGKLNISFQSLRTYSGGTFTAKYSTNYNGYGAPSTATWNNLDVTMATSSSWTNSGNVTVNGANIHIAIVYTSTTESAGAYYIKNFTAKQCYPITYYANGGTGTTTDANSPYAVGTEVAILDNGFTAPEGKEFTKWNTQSDGKGTDKNPDQTITMTTAGYELYAIWGIACVLKATMSASTGEAVYDYNSGNKRFNINLSSSVDEYGGCDIFDYGFVYSTTVANPTVGADNCTKVQVGDSQPTVDVAFEETLENVTNGATYYVRSYATNAAGTAYSDVISVAVPANFPTWTISYTTNGEDETTTTSIYKGAPISGLLAAPEQNIPAGYTFMGWYGSDYALNNEAPTFVKNGDAIISNLALKAVFAIQTGGGSANTYSLVEDDDDLNDGDIVVLYSSGSYKVSGVTYTFSKANGGISDGLFSDEDVEVDNDQFTSTDVVPMTLVKTNSKWKLQIGNQFVGAVNKGVSLNNTGSENSISITDGAATITASINSTDYNLQYNPNNGNGRFAYYSSTQKPISLYKQNTPTYSSYCTSVSSQTVISGTITDGHLTTDGTIAEGTAVYLTTPLTINNGVTLTVNGALATDNPAKLIIEDGGQLICSNSVAATVKKSIANANGKNPKNHWYTISAPVHTGSNNYVTIGNETTVNLTNNGAYDMFAYQESTHTWLNQKNNGEANGFDKMYAGQGYIYRNSGNELSYVGNTTVGPVNIALSYTSDLDVDDLKGFNLIGNPYTHSIAKGSGKAIDNTKLSTGCYALTNSGIWTIIEDGAEIKPNQGVLVEVSGTVADFQIEDINYVAPTPDPGKYKNDNIKFIVESSEYSDAAYAWFDKGIGLTKINHRNESAPMLYIPQDDNNYAIATMTDNTKVFGLNFKAATAGKYTLSYKATGDYNYLHVIDRLTGADVDMLLEGAYSFIGTPKDSENRFIVHLEYMPNYGEEGNDIFAYQSGSEILVSGQGELQVFDVTGRRVMTTTINGAESINLSAQGVYILKLNEKVQKIVVR